jgi:hypothetical protein
MDTLSFNLLLTVVLVVWLAAGVLVILAIFRAPFINKPQEEEEEDEDGI